MQVEGDDDMNANRNSPMLKRESRNNSVNDFLSGKLPGASSVDSPLKPVDLFPAESRSRSVLLNMSPSSLHGGRGEGDSRIVHT